MNIVERPGPPSKVGYPGMAFNACRGVVCHSMVGSLMAAFGELYKLERRASWHYSIAKDGTIYRHYPDKAVTWHAGTARYNGIYIGIEHEGGGPGNESEPLTLPQREASVALVRSLALEHAFPLVREIGLREHNELSQTACPSGRIPWEYYTVEDDMAITLALTAIPIGGGVQIRLYALGQAAPVWIADKAQADDLISAFGQPKELDWATLVRLGAT